VGERAQALADRFTEANADFTAMVEQIPSASWDKMASAGDPRPIGVLARHVAWGYTFEMSYFQAIAEGHPRPPVQEVDTLNAKLAREWRSTPRGEVLLELRSASQAVEDWVRGLTDEQLSRSGQFVTGGTPRSVEVFIDRILIGHIGTHLADVRSALET
jgi:DinB superfamily